MSRLKQYVRAELKDSITLNKLNGSDMDWTATKIDAIVDSIMFDINEIGPEYDLQEIISWNLDQNVRHF